jgi:hypothetical protein
MRSGYAGVGHDKDRGSGLIKFLIREAVTIALLFSGLMAYMAGAMPSVFHSTLLVAGLAGVWMAVLMTGVNRL